jgi:hypothetical protein
VTRIVLDWDDAVGALRALEGRQVSVRIAHRRRSEELIVVVQGHLGPLSRTEKRPSLFWPVGAPEQAAPVERPGLYIRAEEFERGELRPGGVVVIEQSDVLTNVWPLA